MGLNIGGVGAFIKKHKAKIGAAVAVGGGFLAGAVTGKEALLELLKLFTG